MMRIWLAALAALLLLPAPALAGPSVYSRAPDDPAAVTVKGVGDGRADDSAAIQAAIDQAAKSGHGGIVWLPSGRYRISRTLLVRPAVRIFGVGRTRPVILLGANTPGFGAGIATMGAFVGNDQYNIGQYNQGRAAVPPPTVIPFDPNIFDASSNTFYSALANVDFEIGAGNAGAAAVRMRTAQHSFLRHVDFRIGSGLAGIYQAGNACADLHFYGGRYGILAEKTSPAWQFTLLDSTFTGQREAAIREHEMRLTLVNVAIADTPVGILIDRGHDDSLWGKDVRFDNVARAAVLISNERSVFTQIGFDNALASRVPTFARFRESGRTVPGRSLNYRMKHFHYGLALPGPGRPGDYATIVEDEPLRRLPARRPPAIRPLPPVEQWVDVRSLGVRGDDESDDTAALQRAIDRHRILYLPSGRYRVTDTLRLRPDTILVALHPGVTQIYLPDDLPAYAGIGGARALIESARGGDAIVSGLGLWTGGVNPRATALLWKAGEASLVDDVKIQGGGGTWLGDRRRSDFADPRWRLGGQQPSIWVTDGGGGTFAAIWSPNTLASAGFYVSDTSTPGRVYELSAEHHLRAEIVLDRVENWEFLAPQTEQEVRDGVDAIAMEIRGSRNITFANGHHYRVTRSLGPAPAAIRLYDSGDLRFFNVHVNAESGFASCDPKGCGTFVRASKYPFENVIRDMTGGGEVREREFARLVIPPPGRAPATAGLSGTDAAGAAAPAAATVAVRTLETGFRAIGGAAVDAQGRLYFIDRGFHLIYRWSAEAGLAIVHDASFDPVNLAVDRSGDLLVLSSAGRDGSVYAIRPGRPDAVRTIAPTPVRARPGAATLLPVSSWHNGEFRDRIDPVTYEYPTMAELFAREVGEPKPLEYVSPDGSLVLPAFRVWNQGPLDTLGWRWSDTLDSFGFVAARPGERVFVTNASENRTYSGLVGAGGALTDLRPFAGRGGESVARDPAGNVYVANGEVFVYAPDGRPLRTIRVPERPLQLVFGGRDGRTLFILAHRTLFAVDVGDATAAPGAH
jgi:sugar lactone lactonase YvrE